MLVMLDAVMLQLHVCPNYLLLNSKDITARKFSTEMFPDKLE